jgi:predicted dehydrogenase
MKKLNVAIIGCGLVGQKRAAQLAGCKLVACADADFKRAQAVASQHSGAEPLQDWRKAVARKDVNAVIVATPHALLAPITVAALNAGKHVLVEKPAAHHPEQLDEIEAAAQRAGTLVRIGFNHRYHPSFQKARQLVDAGALGELMFVRARYGHGGRVGYDREWRADPKLAGGGELLEQGVHIIDLARWFLGEFTEVEGFAHTYFWNQKLDDNGFMLLKTAKKQVAFMHASCTEWKNTFSFEIYGKLGKLDIFGLGGSYGTERIAWYAMQPQMGPPPTTIWEFPMADNSWGVEFAEFVEDIRHNRQPSARVADARAAWRVVKRIYEMSGK